MSKSKKSDKYLARPDVQESIKTAKENREKVQKSGVFIQEFTAADGKYYSYNGQAYDTKNEVNEVVVKTLKL